jgi:hypothetical protein
MKTVNFYGCLYVCILLFTCLYHQLGRWATKR